MVKRSVIAPSYGLISAQLRASAGNWDLGVFDAKTGRPVVGSAHFGARELAEGVVRKGQHLVIQACRRTGRSEQARITVSFEALTRHGAVQLVRVSTPTLETKKKLASLGLQVSEHPGPDYDDVFIFRPQDAKRIGKAGLISSVLVEDVNARNREGDGLSRRAAITGLPSGRTGTYRHLADYTNEMNAFASNYPTIVKKFTLPLMTLDPPGRPIEGIEISTDVNARDGKPVFLMMGLHHAREWPSGEHTIEWAWELICGFTPDPPGAPDLPCPDSSAAPDPRVVNLLQKTRILIVPVVNPDGFNISREVGEAYGHGGGHDGNALTAPDEYRRKNCRNEAPPPPAPATASCAGPAFGAGSTGVDLNRNYGTFWGGPGSSSLQVDETFHGPHCVGDEPVKQDDPFGNPNCGPFSERETENMRRLISQRHVTVLITNHTQSGLVLRAPGLASQGLAPDEPAMKALGDAMAVQNGYTSQYGWQLYDTTGTTEDWSYNTTGGYGYTFEIGRPVFHPTFLKTIQEYDGTSTVFTATGGNREAYFLANEATSNTAHHSVLHGAAPAGAVLRLKKVFQTPTSIKNQDGTNKSFTDTLDTTMVVPPSGSYEWHINPSTRPLVVDSSGRASTGDPSAPIPFSGSVAGPPADGAVACGNGTNPPVTCTNVHPFTIPAQGGGVDNALVAVSISWLTPGSDWDMKIFRDVNGNGLVDAPDGAALAVSDQGTTASESTSISEPFVAGQYLVQVINFAATEPYNGTVRFYGPEPPVGATVESWTMTCELIEGTAVSTQQVFINRGQQKTINFTPECGPTTPTGVQVASFAARNTKVGVAISWRTANESNLAGFNLWRAGKKLNRARIAAKHSGSIGGASYRFVDRSARAGVKYSYRLQAVARDGSRAWVRTATIRAKR